MEDDLITTNPNISLTQSPGGWFTSLKWLASVKEGDTRLYQALANLPPGTYILQTTQEDQYYYNKLGKRSF